ncbi:antitoxin [Candidatus Marithrix sp. Canyon 246]|uniref:antitoxin n=1 Tax=Candidatus Marithrix sp. Canyon 246 TaxID=1827136 RepID=UPI000C7EC413|nr:antitoxin [Candidatus Marithrix sp. Canyon 246]
MKEEYDFENIKGHKNPYASKLKQQITIKVETDILEDFQNESKQTGIPYQELTDRF